MGNSIIDNFNIPALLNFDRVKMHVLVFYISKSICESGDSLLIAEDRYAFQKIAIILTNRV